MAEEQLSINDPSFIQIEDVEMNQSKNSDLNSSSLSDIQLMEELIQEQDTLEKSSDNIVNIEKPTLAMNEERSTESPTTADTFSHKCALCLRILSSADDPKLLECLHDACGSCVHSKFEEQVDCLRKGILCPTCNHPSVPETIIDNQFLLELTPQEDTTKSVELKCNSCGDDNMASSWCVDCGEFICDICVQAHQRLKVTKDHVIKPKEEGVLEQQSSALCPGAATLYCSVHPHEKLSVFCENCDQLTCRDCQLTQHREHKYKFASEIAQDARKFISSMLNDITYKRVLLSSAMKVIEDRQSLITDKKKTLVNEITQLVVKLTNTINVRGKELVAKLTEVCDGKQRTLQEKKSALDQLSQMTDHCISFTKHALDNGSDMALLYSKKHVTNHLQRIKSKRADIPNPEIPVRIHLALDKVPDLVKVISTIGQIVVDGRVYPSQAPSPSAALPPQNSPSPGHQQMPGNVLHQQLQSLHQGVQLQQPQHQPQAHHNQQQNHQQQNHQQQNHQQPNHQQQNHQPHQPHHQQQGGMHPNSGGPSQQQQPNQQPMHTSFQQQQHPQQQPRMLPPYGQQYGQNMGLNIQGNQQNLVGKIGPNMGNIAMQGNIPISLAQHLQNQNHMQQQRMPMQRGQLRSILPPRPGLNSQQQVTSSTHPQGMLQDRSNLRGLLQPNGNAVYVRTGPTQYQAVQPQYAQQFQNRFQSPPQQFQQQVRMMQHGPQIGIRMTRAMPPYALSSQQQQQQQQQQIQQQQHQQQQQQQPGLKWHIPQQADGNNSINRQNLSIAQPSINDNFKIMLKPQSDLRSTPSVSSTIPKTPSPNSASSRSDAENSLDKYCAESVNDLMATIAKLDSNGVQVLAENRGKTGGSPHVDSSTGDLAGPSAKVKNETMESGKDDPNEDWCAVCMDGGELVCCDKCPKVFHQSCHIPNLRIEENDTWQCLLCMNFADIPESALGEKKEGQLSIKEKKIAERLILEMYCQYEPSIPFRELPSSDNIEYYSVIKKPIALDTIRQKLDWSSINCYTNLEYLVRDVRLMFKNAYTYNALDSDIYNDAKTLEKFFDEQLEKWVPEYAYETFDDDDIHPPNKKYKRIIND